MNIQTLSAREYYGRHATGRVVLVDFQPVHFVGKTALKDSREFMKKLQKTIDEFPDYEILFTT